MSDTSIEPPNDHHAWVHENLAAYLAGGLNSEERARLDAHVNSCAECFDAFTEARDADRAAQRALAGLLPAGVGAAFEDRLITHTRETAMNRWKYPLVRRAAYATAAAVALAATGVFANFAMHQNGRLSNPLSRELAANADAADPSFGNPIDQIKSRWSSSDDREKAVAARIAQPTGMQADGSEDPDAARIMNDAHGQLADAESVIRSAATASAQGPMGFRFTDVPMTDVLAEMSKHYGITIFSPQSVNQRVTIQVPQDATKEEGIKLAQNMLAPMGMQLLAQPAGQSGLTSEVYRVVAVSEARKAQIPVFEGSDPAKIPNTDNLITQIIPLQNVDAARTRNDLAGLISADADVAVNTGSNTLVITDTSAKIRRLTEALDTLDHQKSLTTVIQYRQLASGNAADAARAINSKFSSALGQTSGGAGFGGAGGGTANGLGKNLNSRVYADSDARTNTVVLNGPPDQVEKAIKSLDEMELNSQVASAQRLFYAPSGSSGLTNLHTFNQAIPDGQETMRQNIDSVEHLIPYADLMVYPDNWPEITRKREMSFAQEDANIAKSRQAQPQGGTSGLRSSPNIVEGFNQTTVGGGAGLGGGGGGEGAITIRDGSISANKETSTFVRGGIGGGYLPFDKLAAKADTNVSQGSSVDGGWVGGEPGKPSQLGDVAALGGAFVQLPAYSASNGNISDSGGFNKAGSGTLTVNGSLMVNGTTVQTGSGNLSVNGGTFTTTGANTFSGGTTNLVGGNLQVASNVGGAPQMNFNGGTMRAAGIISNGSVDGEKQLGAPGLVSGRYATETKFDTDKGAVVNAPTINLGGGSLSTDGRQFGASSNLGLFNQSIPGANNQPDRLAVDGKVVTRGDALDVSVFELVTPGQDYKKQSKVDAQGNIHIDNIGDLHVEGLTPQQIEQKISQAATEKGLLLAKGNGSPAPQVSAKIADTGYEFGTQNSRVAKDTNGQLAYAATRPQDPTRNATTTQQPSQQSPPPQQPPQAIAQLKIIRNGTIEFEVRSFDDAYLTVARIVGDDGGFVSSTSSEKLANGHVRGTIVVRVPPERLERFLLELRSLGDLKAQQIAANDVTKQYTDTESELRGLRTMETRLLDLIKNGKGEVKDLVEAEKQLGEYRVRIETLEGQLSYYNNLVSLATISISAYEKDIATPTAASEQESVNLSVETEEVEAKYQAARKTLDDAKARIVESQLRNTDAEHVAAHIVADVPPDKADFVAGQLKTLGTVTSFNRDRKQTTTGGTGVPSVQVEQKDTRITVELFNLANLSPRETTVIRVAVPNVESTYSEILSKVRAAPGNANLPIGDSPKPDAADKPTGRILSSNLTGQLPEQMAADIRAEIRSENTADILADIKKSGEVLSSSLSTNSDNASTTAAKRGIQLTLVNIAAVPPKEYHTLNIAVRDVDKAYNDLLAEIRKDVSKEDATAGGVNPLLPPTVGRLLASNVNGQQPEQKTADVQADIRSDKIAEVLVLIQNAAGNEVMNNSTAESPEQINFTRTKERLQVRFINVAAIAPRETRTQRLVAITVPEAYKKLQDSLATLAAKGDVRVITSQLNESDARNVTANLTFEARRDALAAVDAAFTAAGISFLSGNTNRSPDVAGTLDSKVLFNIENISAADSLEPRRTVALTLEVDNIDKALDALRDSMKRLLPPGEGLDGTNAREIDFNVARDMKGKRRRQSHPRRAQERRHPPAAGRQRHAGRRKEQPGQQEQRRPRQGFRPRALRPHHHQSAQALHPPRRQRRRPIRPRRPLQRLGRPGAQPLLRAHRPAVYSPLHPDHLAHLGHPQTPPQGDGLITCGAGFHPARTACTNTH